MSYRLKRPLDIGLATVGCLLFAPVMLIIVISIYLDDRGTILFKQQRIGQYRRPFMIFKFRSMNAQGVTRVGRWLRATGLDELPQFINILRGEMTIVAPRPLTQADIVRLGWDKPAFDARWSLPSGITGLAQLYSGHSARVSAYLDKRYIEQSSLSLDSYVIVISFLINVLGKQRVRAWLRPKKFSTTLSISTASTAS
ncbi:glycosyl transferase possibly involved in lipopolysaccharide synthesis [Beggiatoa alba B18LD]|uniref:Glycosyl transferase possibly involved in lipopolysaccharide synthesis n=1 Tax=Beggiatoa alba B18LD TaxID=395493 RepID=I3CC80_9GAMM|nr:sugar transferase [Beggiatoa alba]EIJ41223.1 glycosyl transferase possibly involved in lipopolysaccharide synthesis [Beggiatoa alba B18LD]